MHGVATVPKPAARTRRPPIGAHVSTAGHIDVAVANAEKIGAEAMQIFGAAPQQWRRKQHSAEDVQAFREKAAAAGIGPNYIHAIYLINLASDDRELVAKGVETLIADMRLAGELGVAGVIFHVGSHKGAGFQTRLPQMVKAVKQVLAESPDQVWLCIENNAGTGNSVGSTFPEIAAIMDGAGSDRVKVCLDTCHAYSAGYDLAQPKGLNRALREFKREIGYANLVAVHANDSKTPFGSGKDRHENIGAGSLGLSAFETILHHPAFRTAAWLLEVPGFKGGGPDALNVQILRALRDGTALPKIPAGTGAARTRKKPAAKSAAKRVKARRQASAAAFVQRYLSSAASHSLALNPTSKVRPAFRMGRFSSRGSLSISRLASASSNDSGSMPSFFTLGLRAEKMALAGRPPRRALRSAVFSGCLKKSRSS